MNTTRTATLLLMVAGTAAWGSGWLPAQPAPQPPRSLDEQLLDELDADPLDELDRALFEPGKRQAKPGDPAGEGPEDLGTRLRRELGAAGVAEDESPVLKVARQMRDVEGRIAGNDSGLNTQGMQQQIIANLDRLIEEARKSCRGGKSPKPGASGGQRKQGSGGTRPSDKPAAAGTQRTGEGEKRQPDRQQVQTMMQQLWDVALPQQQRKQLLQSPFDEFLPKYELLIEQYFRRLSEETDE